MLDFCQGKASGGGSVTIMYRDGALGPIMIKSCIDIMREEPIEKQGSCHVGMRPVAVRLMMGHCCTEDMQR